jgi:hypothetical protein
MRSAWSTIRRNMSHIIRRVGKSAGSVFLFGGVP